MPGLNCLVKFDNVLNVGWQADGFCFSGLFRGVLVSQLKLCPDSILIKHIFG